MAYFPPMWSLNEGPPCVLVGSQTSTLVMTAVRPEMLMIIHDAVCLKLLDTCSLRIPPNLLFANIAMSRKLIAALAFAPAVVANSCPSSSALVHASCQVKVTADATCSEVWSWALHNLQGGPIESLIVVQANISPIKAARVLGGSGRLSKQVCSGDDWVAIYHRGSKYTYRTPLTLQVLLC